MQSISLIKLNPKQFANDLKFFGVHQNLEARVAQAVAQSLHPTEFLALLLQDEHLYHKDRLTQLAICECLPVF